MDSAAEQSRHLSMYKLRVPKGNHNEAGTADPATLPFTEIIPDTDGPLKKLTHFVDVIADYDGAVPHQILLNLGSKRDFKNFPAPFNLAVEPLCEYTMQVFAVPQANGKTCIYKHVILKERQSVPVVLNCGKGVVHKMAWGTSLSCAAFLSNGVREWSSRTLFE